jgi:cytochrome c oxidase cbb3-type subunit 3
MFLARGVFLMIGLALLAACAPESETPAPSAVPGQVQSESWRESRMLAGKETYEEACASCHDEGQGDAPAIGDRDAWSGRSGLWVAVLSEHATAGYLDMPEKGGHGELSDDDVDAAAEYMLMKTFPELPPD